MKNFKSISILLIVILLNVSFLLGTTSTEAAGEVLDPCTITGYTTAFSNHFACDGWFPNCVPSSVDTHNC